MTQVDLKEVESTGTLKAGEKTLADLRKRKLIVQRLVSRIQSRLPTILIHLRLEKDNGSPSRRVPTLAHQRRNQKQISQLICSHRMFSINLLHYLSEQNPCSGAWKTSTFKKYNFEAEGAPTAGGALHPLLKVREEFRNIFLEMGCVSTSLFFFVLSILIIIITVSQKCPHPPTSSLASGALMPSSSPNNILPEICKILSTYQVNSSPHPREIHPNTIKSDPAVSLPPSAAYYDRVSSVHVNGGFGSEGYRAPWSRDESRKLLLRTHTTSSSAQMLYKLAAKCRGEEVEDDLSRGESVDGTYTAQPAKEPLKDGDDGFRPAKLFSIDRVFRNETMDATHLAEFHQVEGVVADKGLTLADLIGGY